MLAAGGDDGMIRIFDVNHSNAIMGFPAFETPCVSVRFCDGDNQSILTCDNHGGLTRYDMRRPGHALVTYTTTVMKEEEGALKKQGIKQGGDKQIAVTHSGKHFTTSYGPNTLFYDLESASPVQILQGCGVITTMDWAPMESPILIQGTMDNHALLKRFKTSKEKDMKT
jgi:hypothetical protein